MIQMAIVVLHRKQHIIAIAMLLYCLMTMDESLVLPRSIFLLQCDADLCFFLLPPEKQICVCPLQGCCVFFDTLALIHTCESKNPDY
ncbi:MAG: hypothetical protein BYD32DRAFT_175448 [Podila humilis]|nr:MAG: hypothetical protein BYD32DRAFT_175448 [Podila humilis]